MDDATLAELQELEESLWRADTRFEDAVMDRILAKDFCEFGRSGRVYERTDMMVGHGVTPEIEATLPLQDLRIRTLSGDIAQILYVSEVRYGTNIERANRSSIWRRTGQGWQLCFHQGTPI